MLAVGLALPMLMGLAIPAANGLLGSHAYLQASALAPGADALHLDVGNGIDRTFGNQ